MEGILAMKSGKILILAAAVICIGLVYLARPTADVSRPEAGTAALNGGEAETATARASAPARITAVYLTEQDGDAAARVDALRKSHRRVEDNLNARMMLSEAEGEQFAEVNNLRTAEMEKELVESMTSLTKHLVNEPSSTTSAIGLLKLEQDPQLMILIAQSLGEAAAAMGEDFPYDLLVDIAANDPDHARRQAALLTLGYMSEVPDDLRLRIVEISQSAPTPEIRAAAVDVMGQWMIRNPELVPSVSEALLTARETNTDPLVRGMVIQTIGNSNAPLTPKVFDAMNDALLNEPVAGNRSLAAVALGSGASPDNREAVITALEEAYQGEQTLETRRHIITQIAKAGKGDAATYLQRLPTPDPLLTQDVIDYVEIIAGGNPDDWGSIWAQKSERNSERGTYPGGHGGHGHESE